MRYFYLITALAVCLLLSHIDGVYMYGRFSNVPQLSGTIDGMRQLLKIEKKLIDNLAAYAHEIQSKINQIHEAIEPMRMELKRANYKSAEYLSIPMNSFKLIRRLHWDWLQWQKFMNATIGAKQIQILRNTYSKLPTKNDLRAAVQNLYRLQQVYNLDASHIAKGKLQRKQHSTKFSALDCYVIGTELMHMNTTNPGHINDAGRWFNVALQQFVPTNIFDIIGFNQLHIYMHYTEMLAKQFRWQEMFEVLDTAFELYSHEPNFLTHFDKLQTIANVNLTANATQLAVQPTTFHRGCRGELPVNRSSLLTCHLDTVTSAFLKLAPNKIEIVSIDPLVTLYYDVLSDAEIGELLQLAKPHLNLALTIESANRAARVTGAQQESHYARHLPNVFANKTRHLYQRMADMTALRVNVKDTEALQILYYESTGYVFTHSDSFHSCNNANHRATVLLYLSDSVNGGGATVFPNIPLALWPRKGMAVVWHNQREMNNDVDRMEYGSCPILRGTKWVFTKFIRNYYQN